MKTCNICKKRVDETTSWRLGKQTGSICNKCLRDIKHFIDENYYTMPLELIWQGLESWNVSEVETSLNYLDQLPRTSDTLERIDKIRVCRLNNEYVVTELMEFADELEEELSR